MKAKKLITMLLVVCMVLAMAACGKSEPAQSGDGVRVLKIGYSYSNLDENLTKNWNFMQQAWAAWDEAHPEFEVELICTGANGDVAKQLADVESLITQQCDAIYIMVVDSEGSIPAIEAIVDAGIICVDAGYIANTKVSDMRMMTSDPHTQGMLQAEYVEAYLEANPDEILYVGWLYGNPAAASTLARHDGVAYLAEKYPDRFIVLEEQYGNWLVEDSMAIMEAWVQNYPQMNCIMAASDDMAIGCINVLQEQGIDPTDYLILGIDGSKSGFAQVEAGTMDGTVLMAMGTTSKYAVDIISSLILGLDTSAEFGVDLTTGDVNLGGLSSAMVTKDNIDGMYELAGVPRD